MNNPIVLDTHILLWSLLQPEELSKETKQHIITAQDRKTASYFSAPFPYGKLLC